MTARTFALITVAAALVTADAHAEPAKHGRYERDKAVSLVFTGGAINHGAYGGGGMGARVEWGRKLPVIHLVGEYSLMYFFADGPDDTDTSGIFQRAGVTARRPVSSWLSDDESAEIGFWLEAGVAIQRMPAVGGAHTRPDAIAGFLVEVRTENWGVLLGSRLVLAREPDGALSGKQDPTAGSQRFLDTGILITLGGRWGQK